MSKVNAVEPRFDECECPCHTMARKFPHIEKFCCEKPNEVKDPREYALKILTDPDRVWPGYVYFVLVGSGDPFVKIGYSEYSSPFNRVVQLQVGCPYELKLMGIIKPKGRIAKQLETEIHEDLKDFRIRGEWFEVTEAMDKWLVQLELMDDIALSKHCGDDE